MFYRRALEWALDHRWTSVVLATILFFLSIALVVPLPKGVQPEGNPNFLSVAIEAPPGSTIGDMRAVVSQVHDLLAAQPEAESVFAQVGNGGASGGPGGFTSECRRHEGNGHVDPEGAPRLPRQRDPRPDTAEVARRFPTRG